MAQSDEALGTVHWAVIETVTGREIGAGTLDVSSEDVTIEEHRTAENVTFYKKRVRLTGPFSFAIDEHPCRDGEEMKGFGFTATNDEVGAYSWEWFNVTSPTEAVKLQEEGRLKIDIAKVACGTEVIKTEFLTDVSLRLTRFFGDPTQEPFWRVLIRKGSCVAWPAVEPVVK